MTKRFVWILVSCLMVLSLVIASCGPKAAEKKAAEGGAATVTTKEEAAKEAEEEAVAPSPEVPIYGGTLTLALATDPMAAFYDLFSLGSADPQQLSHNRVWDGDWTKGPAGGYGTSEVDWGEGSYIPDLQVGHLAQSISWVIDPGGKTVTTTIEVKKGIHWALDPNNQYSRLVNGREVTTDDIIWCLDQRMNNPEAMNYQFFPQQHGIHCVKTGPQEIQITHPFAIALEGFMRLFNSVMMPPELYTRYGRESCVNWKYDVGTGPFIITDYIPSNMVTMDRNPNYWMNDPIGPGMGNQLPYLDRVKYVVIPDRSTMLAALRTGNVDQLGGFNGLTLEEKTLMINQVPDLKVAQRGAGLVSPIFMRTDKPELPFSKKNVRRAMMMATDFQTINKSLYAGLGDLVSWPYRYAPAYADLYLGLDDPECPDSVRELYTYNPDKAKELLTEAGYPTGFKCTLTLTQVQVDYYSIIKDQWAKANINLELKVIEGGAVIGTAASLAYDMIAIFFSPVFTYPEQAQYTTGTGWLNASLISDPYIDDQAKKIKETAITDFRPSMKLTKELLKYVLDQAYCIPTPAYPIYSLWWPWLKNYSGETSVGYAPGYSWVEYIWYDQALRKSMGY
jgi:peptide/nickel transport system substrate-binding protein